MRRSRLKDPVENRIKELIEMEREFYSLFEDAPVPMWHKVYDSKSKRFFMDKVNDAYTDATGITPQAYRGQSDDAVWEDETAGVFYKNDAHVILVRHMLQIEELVLNPSTQTAQYAIGYKWPHIVGRKVLGIWGMANLFEKDVWESIRASHPFYLRNTTALDKRWRELYQEEPPR